MKKPPKPKPKRPRGAVPPVEKKEIPAQSEEWWSSWKRLFAVIGGIATVLGLGSTIMHYWPQISVEPTAAAEPSNPFSGYFKITNDQGYPLTNVGIEASLRCAKLGRGDDTSPPKECLPSMHNSKTVWTNHTLEPHEPYEITPGDLMFVTPGGLLYAQISIFVSYRPWRIPWTMTNELRFQSRRLSDGKIEWLHIPAD